MKLNLSEFKQNLKTLKSTLCDEFINHANITHVTNKLVSYIDDLLLNLFNAHQLENNGQFCLIALGSYGRRELQLYSDVDLLILHHENISENSLNSAQQFIQDCWDIGLEISHQITTVKGCTDLAQYDLSVISSLQDMHLICGQGALMEELRYETHVLHMWNSHDYYDAKEQEQRKRHEKYNETAYNLEPNVKFGPGGLRDLQVIFTIAKRHFGIHELVDGINYGFITEREYEELTHCQHFLWRVRFALHLLSQKREDRLLFDLQIKLAHLFGYQDTTQSLGIEQFMKAYFKVIKSVRELNEMLLQWFSEVIVHQQKQTLTPLNDLFQLSNRYIEVRHPRVFIQNPNAILDIFLTIAKRPDIEDVRAGTIRLIRQSVYLINKNFRASYDIAKCFMTILKIAHDPYDILQRMSSYGVLGQYLDCFASVTGQMQYDLFHAYTVEQHTLFVIRNLTRFSNKQFAAQFPLCAKLMPNLQSREILYLAALFHDIAKGRGGDHSKLGAHECKLFAKRHHLKPSEKKLLVWLVEHHLLMSQTAQRRDIYDPMTIQQFCNQLPHPHYLDYLYLLTVADICGTNPNLWNAWKDSLLQELYYSSQKMMTHEQALLDEKTLIKTRKQKALKRLTSKNGSKTDILNLWDTFKGVYFLHESPEIIARHTLAILNATEYPIILILPHHTQGGTEIFIYMPHNDERFTITTTILSNHRINILEAQVMTCVNQFDLDTYIVLDECNQAILDKDKIYTIQSALKKHLSDEHSLPAISQKRLSRTQVHFQKSPEITFSQDQHHERTLLFLVTNDRAGLLATISRVFLTERIHLHNAKIATAGARVEDMFFISNQHGHALTMNEETSLQHKLVVALS